MTSLVVNRSAPLRGVVRVPGDKSISHRAIIFSALSRHTVRIQNLLEGEDVLRTVEIFRKLGVPIQKSGKTWIVKGKGADGLRPCRGVLTCGNSGTTMRLMMGVLAALPFKSQLTGDKSLNRRPMERVARPLRRMGARVTEIRLKGKRIIQVQGPVTRGISYRLPVASAQLKSALLLAGMISGLKVKVTEPVKSRDHTERMMKIFKKRVRRLIVPGDPSSAAFFVVAGLISRRPRTRIVIRSVCLNPTRTGFLKMLARMGGKIKILNRKVISGEPAGDLLITPARLHRVKIAGRIVPSLIDEAPVLAVAAASADGRSVFSGMEELRVKESDRIKAIVSELKKFGVKIRERPDGFIIDGGGGSPRWGSPRWGSPRWGSPRWEIQGASVKSHGDHRIAMALAILATVAEGKSRIADVDCIRTSFPQFLDLLKGLVGRLRLTH